VARITEKRDDFYGVVIDPIVNEMTKPCPLEAISRKFSTEPASFLYSHPGST